MIVIIRHIFLLLFGLFFVPLWTHAERPIRQKVSDLEALVESNKSTDTSRIWLLVDLENAYFHHNPTKFESRIQELKTLSQKLGCLKGLVYGYGFESFVALRKSDFKLSLSLAYEALKVANKLKDPEMLAFCYKLLGNINAKTVSVNEGAELPKAIDYFRQQVYWALQTKDPYTMSIAHQNLGMGYIEIKNYKAALRELNKSQTCIRGKNFAYNEGYTLNLMGRAYIEQGYYKSALGYLKQGEMIADRLELNRLKELIYHHLGKAYMSLHQPDEAEPYFLKSLALYQKGNIAKTLPTLELLSKVNVEKKDFKRALMFSNRYIKIRDSIFTDDKNKAFIELQIKYETQQKEHRYQLLQLQNLTIQQENKWYFTVLFSVVALLLIAGLLYLQLYRSRNALANVNHIKDKMFAIVAHDLKRPVVSFQNLTRTLNYLIRNQRYEQLMKVGVEAETMATEMNLMLDNIFRWSLHEKEGLFLKQTTVSLDNVLKDLTEEFHYLAHTKQVNLRLNLQAGIEILADRTLLLVILRNLVNNALKFTPKQGEVIVSSIQRDTQTEIVVKDTGIGIPPSIQQKLFVQDFHKSRLGLNGERGLGLGLVICSELIKYLPAKLTCDSVEGKGSQFMLIIESAQFS